MQGDHIHGFRIVLTWIFVPWVWGRFGERFLLWTWTGDFKLGRLTEGKEVRKTFIGRRFREHP